METVKTFLLLFFAGLLVSLPETKPQRPPPLCASQYALVNYACAFTPNSHSNDRVYLFDQGLNYTQIYTQAQRSGDEPSRNHTHRNQHGAHNHNHGPHQHQGGHNHRHEHEGGHSEGHRGHGRGHHSRHEDEEEHEGGHRRGHRYRGGHGRGHHSRNEDEEEHEGGHQHRHRGHRHRHRHHGSSSRGECCKWLSELDDECVCALLVRLPPFLSRQQHKYTVRVGGSCKVSYKCPGRVRL